MHKERNVKTKASAFTRVEKVCMRVIGVERLNMQLYLFYWMLCMCECLCVGARHEISSQQRYQGNCSESDRGGKLFVSFTSEFLSVNSLDQNCLLFGSHQRPFKSHLSQRRVRVGVIHKYTQPTSGQEPHWKRIKIMQAQRASHKNSCTCWLCTCNVSTWWCIFI